MCGRFEIHSTIEIIARLFQIDDIAVLLTPSYNVAPSQEIAIVIHDGKNRLVPCRWGFVPAWSRELKTGYPMINARAETAATNRSYKEAFENHRCIVPADGFYEWDKNDTTRTPHYVRRKNGRPMGLAGLYTVWTSPGGDPTCTCAIITTDANELVAPIHRRMPVILPEDRFAHWLDPKVRDKDSLLALLKPFANDELEMYAVTTKVNSYKVNDPGNIRPVEATSE